ncbi:glycosyltransferase family 4 protein [Paracidovorax cattleyae]|uniref:Glycosyltransferase involved in cell wall bisynthesis n=2 Tax=Paracidovorax cattleyae TaxID=80868 RepID=A0A1H0W783_9BURK|nr:glycosyltransferase family 4 protein [Paracidovorax cattleyae]AVS73416.1 glycosyltransferase family 1 protein [Paracidovorax cattleyae]SDP86599.1 Glycosyltransferase involved in cell wall bisynthesis [Paracidovorax cattleyae]
MRILHVYKDFAPHAGGGGVARHIHGLAVLAAQAGHTPRVAAPRAEEGTAHGYAAVRAEAWQLWEQVGWADVVHVHGARTPIAAWAALLARLRGRRVVYTPHCYYDDDPGPAKRLRKRCWDLLAERRLLRGADRVVLLSDHWVDYLRHRGMAPGDPVVLPNAVLEAELAAPPASAPRLEGTPALLSVGRLDAVKRLHDAIAVLAEPGMEAAVLHLVGRGPDRARLEEAARSRGVAARVRFHGFIDDAGVAEMAAGADVFVMPSAVEGMPTVLIEMLLLGCPVVASDIPGNRPILEEAGLTGALYPTGDVAAFAARVRQQGQHRVAPCIAARIRACFTWEGLRPRVLALYGALVREAAS